MATPNMPATWSAARHHQGATPAQHLGKRQLEPNREQQQHNTDLRERRNLLGIGNQRNAVWTDDHANEEKPDEGRHVDAMGQRDDRDGQTDDDRQVAKHAEVLHGVAMLKHRSGGDVTASTIPIVCSDPLTCSDHGTPNPPEDVIRISGGHAVVRRWTAWAQNALNHRLQQTMALSPGTKLGHYKWRLRFALSQAVASAG